MGRIIFPHQAHSAMPNDPFYCHDNNAPKVSYQG